MCGKVAHQIFEKPTKREEKHKRHVIGKKSDGNAPSIDALQVRMEDEARKQKAGPSSISKFPLISLCKWHVQ